MYWYKPWCELRARILLSAAAIAAACGLALFMQGLRGHGSLSYAHFLWGLIYDSLARDLFVVLTVIFGAGGLLQERTQGTAGFTLALPVSRVHVTMLRAAMGYAGVLLMSLMPALVLPLGSPLVGQHYAFAEALRFFVLYACTGAVIYSFTFLLSHVMAGEYSAILLAVPGVVAYSVLIGMLGLDRITSLNFLNVMSGEGMPWFSGSSGLFTGRLPWVPLVVMLSIAAALVYIAGRRMVRREFA
jgi:ABC-2 type transport system permease protein